MGLLFPGRPSDKRSVFGLMVCSARSMAIRMSSSQRSISEAQLDGEKTRTKLTEMLFHQRSFPGDDVHGVYLAATTTDWRCPYRVNEWGTPHSSSLSRICTGTHTSLWNIWLTPVTTPTLWSHTVKPYRGNWPWTLNWLDGVIPRLVYTKESLN